MIIINDTAKPVVAEKALAHKPILVDILDEYDSSEYYHEFEFALRDMSERQGPMWCCDASGYMNNHILLHAIPVRLASGNGYAVVNGEQPCPENAIVDALGAYYAKCEGRNELPYIEIYADEIWKQVRGREPNFQKLFTTIVFHEFMHAFMDLRNYRKNSEVKIQYGTTYGRWREESAANAATLYLLRGYGDGSYYDYARKYMLKQSVEYALGVHYNEQYYCFDEPVHLRGRRDEKAKGVPLLLQEIWLKYVQSAPARKLDADQLRDYERLIDYPERAYSFNGQLYDHRNVVYAVLAHYIRDRHPSLDELKATFPHKDHSPWSEKQTYVKELDRQFYFKDPLKLRDCMVYLYDRWGDPRNTDTADFVTDARKAGYTVTKLIENEIDADE